jgi:hypothetical protein
LPLDSIEPDHCQHLVFERCQRALGAMPVGALRHPDNPRIERAADRPPAGLSQLRPELDHVISMTNFAEKRAGRHDAPRRCDENSCRTRYGSCFEADSKDNTMLYPTPRADANDLWVIAAVITVLVAAGIAIQLL